MLRKVSSLLVLSFIAVYGLIPHAMSFTHGLKISNVGPVPAGVVVGVYGATDATGWTTVGPSNGTLPSGMFTNIIYVSDSLGDDNRDGSTPTFVDDNNTVQFVLSAAATPVVNDVYSTPNGTHVTVAAVPGQGSGHYPFWQMKNRTGTPDASGTLTCFGSCGGPSPVTYTSRTLGIHGPIKTIMKGAGQSGPGPYDPNNAAPGPFFGDGTGLGTIGNWRTAGSVGASFALRSPAPDWLLLRKGDTFTNQTIETGFASGATDNFGKGGVSQLEPMVISSYDENFPVATYGANAGGRARPIIVNPGSTTAFAISKGDLHGYQARPALSFHGGTSSFDLVMGIEFYNAQRDPNSGAAYSGLGNMDDAAFAIEVPQPINSIFIEDVKAGYNASTISFSVGAQDVYIRRNQVHHCFTAFGTKVGIGFPLDGILDNNGPVWHGFNFEENAIDLCGYAGNTFASNTGTQYTRNVYIQWDSKFGNRRGNTSTRSGSENFQFRSGGIIDNNFTYFGSYGFDTGHNEGDPGLTSTTQVTNNVIMSPDNPIGLDPIGLNFLNSDNVTVTGNIVTSGSTGAGSTYAGTDAADGGTAFAHVSNVGSGGVPGAYGCVGLTHVTGGHGTQAGSYSLIINGGGTANVAIAQDEYYPQNIFPSTATYVAGDVLSGSVNHPSINTAGVTLTNAGTGGTRGIYGYAGEQVGNGCAYDPSNSTLGGVIGSPLTNFSGSMAGSDARVAYVIGMEFSSITRTLNGGTGFYEATASTESLFDLTENPVPVNHGISVGNMFTVTGITASIAFTNVTRAINAGLCGAGIYAATATSGIANGVTVGGSIIVANVAPSAYNGTWTAATGTSGNTLVWCMTGVDPGAVSSPNFGDLDTSARYNGTWTAITGTTGSTLKWSFGTAVDPGVPGAFGFPSAGGFSNSITKWQIVGTGTSYVVNDVLTDTDGGLTGVRFTVNSVAHLTGWQMTVDSILNNGVHGLNFINNVIFNWPSGGPVGPPTCPSGPPACQNDYGGTHDSPAGIPGSGAANIWAPNINCQTTVAQFTGATNGTALTSSSLVQGTISNGQTLAGAGLTGNPVIVSGGPTSWVISPTQPIISNEPMFSYTCTPTTVFPDASRSVATYAAFLGISPATIDGYIYGDGSHPGVINNARWNYSQVYTSLHGINPYIRAGFGL